MFASPGRVLLSVFGFDIYWYGLFLAIGILCAVLISDFLSKKYYKQNFVIDFAPFILISGIIFARLYYCLINYGYYMNFSQKVFLFREGGISIHGAILGGILALFIAYRLKKKYDKKFNLSFLALCDIFALGLPLGQAIGRWGNFFNSEAYGLPTNLPWKLYIAPEFRTEQYLNYDYFHPTFLYESILDLLIFVILIFFLKKHKEASGGKITALYLILYSIVRFMIEFLRTDSVLNFGSLHIAHIVSLIMFFTGIFIFVYSKNKK